MLSTAFALLDAQRHSNATAMPQLLLLALALISSSGKAFTSS